MTNMTETARCVLSAAKAVDPNAIIAGGFARDTKLGKDPKDIDVYIQFEPVLRGQQPVQLREMAGAIVWGLKGAGLSVTDLGEEIRREYDGLFAPRRTARQRTQPNVVKLNVEGHTVDLIAVRSGGMNHVWRTFDVGLCMAAIKDPETMEIETDARHDRDAENETLTLYFDQVTEDDRRLASLAHVQRLLQKYEGFEVKVVL